MTFPVGAGVRDLATGQLGRVVRVPRRLSLRGCLAVRFDAEPSPRLIREHALQYVARHYEAARAWSLTT